MPLACQQPRGSYLARLARQGSARFPETCTSLSERESPPALPTTRWTAQKASWLAALATGILSGWSGQTAHASFPAKLVLSDQQEASAACVYVCTHTSSTVAVSRVAGAGKCWHGYVDTPVRKITVMIKLKSSMDQLSHWKWIPPMQTRYA